MGSFSYLSVLISIVLGLGITQLLSAVARAVEHRDTTSLYWPSMTWFTVLLLAHVQTWWSFYDLSTHAQWDFLQFLSVLAQPIGLYFLSVLVLPSERASIAGQKAWYFAHRRAFFCTLSIFIVLSLARDQIISGRLPELTNIGFQLTLFSGAVIGAWTANERFHKIFAVVAFTAFGLYIGVLFSKLGV